ncbi:MAG: trigger factor [bacterium]|nr:trigger factor [bacterium]
MDLLGNIVNDSIKIEKKELEPCLQQIDCVIPADKVETGYNKIAKQYASQAKLSGFRPGKAPISLVKNLYKKNIEEEVTKELLSAAFQKASADNEDDLLSYSIPKDKEPKLELGNDFSFTLRFNIAPQIELPEYKGVKIELEKKEISDEEITKRLDYFRDIYGKFETVETEAVEGDMLKVSYTSDIELAEDAKDNSKRLVNSDLNYVWLNQNDIIPGINAALTGAKTGEEHKHTAKFEDSYEDAALAGKTVNYEIKVIDVQRKAPLTSDEELCTKLMVKDVEELKNRIVEQGEKELENSYTAVKRTKVVDELTKELTFPIPPDMLQDATNNELNYIVNSKLRQSTDKEAANKELEGDKEKLMAEAKESATKRLRNFLLLRKIGKNEKIEVNDSEVSKHIESMSQYYGYKPEDLKQRLISSGNINQVYDEVLINKVTDFIVENAKVEFIAEKTDK